MTTWKEVHLGIVNNFKLMAWQQLDQIHLMDVDHWEGISVRLTRRAIETNAFHVCSEVSLICKGSCEENMTRSAFVNCQQLQINGVTTIGPVGTNAFAGCSIKLRESHSIQNEQLEQMHLVDVHQWKWFWRKPWREDLTE